MVFCGLSVFFMLHIPRKKLKIVCLYNIQTDIPYPHPFRSFSFQRNGKMHIPRSPCVEPRKEFPKICRPSQRAQKRHGGIKRVPAFLQCSQSPNLLSAEYVLLAELEGKKRAGQNLIVDFPREGCLYKVTKQESFTLLC